MLNHSEQVYRGFPVCLVVLVLLAGPSQAQEPVGTHTMRAAVVGGTPGDTIDDVVTWTIDVPRPFPDFVDLEVEIRIASHVEACVTEPELCIPAEAIADMNSSCADRRDNDGDGLVDLADYDCHQVDGWNFGIATDPSFAVQGHSFEGTVADLYIFPAGRIDTNCGAWGRAASPIDPSLNDGLEGIGGFVHLSFCGGRFLDVNTEHVFLRVFGRLDTRALREGVQVTDPVFVRVAESWIERPGREWPSSVVLAGVRAPHTDRVSAAIQLRASEGLRFRRGDANQDGGAPTIGDGIFITDWLFLGGATPPCLDAADVDDNGAVEITDAVRVFSFLFLGASEIPAPGPTLCGLDSTVDQLSCTAFAACP